MFQAGIAGQALCRKLRACAWLRSETSPVLGYVPSRRGEKGVLALTERNRAWPGAAAEETARPKKVRRQN